ncbi:MAG: zinc ribbon domain-containing protein [Verrucomicrobia bacterium]|nr:zinc ribbon domain-containing protein [Verrucomicrobiota bacterium]
MPIYEFHCNECGRDSEALTPTTEWEGTVCPHCGSRNLSKKLSMFAATGGTEGGACSDGSCNWGSSCDTGGCGSCCCGG